MNILDKIVATKHKEVAERSELYPIKLLEKSLYFPTLPVSLKGYLHRPDKSGVIAEIKRRSPSKGLINPYADIEKISTGYMQAGASALSVLTDTEYFGGSNADLSKARDLNFCPILRKDFIIAEYQVIEAKSIGADAVLLIAAILQPAQISQLASLAKSLGLEVLLEIHTRDELELSPLQNIDIIGINNRDLKTFTVSLDTSVQMAPFIPAGITTVSESGIRTAHDARFLRNHGYQGFLIGEQFMRHSHPEKACATFIQELNLALAVA